MLVVRCEVEPLCDRCQGYLDSSNFEPLACFEIQPGDKVDVQEWVATLEHNLKSCPVDYLCPSCAKIIKKEMEDKLSGLTEGSYLA